MSVNKVILIGNVGKTPEVTNVSNSTLAKFSLATSEKYKNKAGEQVESTEWHNITAWGKLAEIIQKYVDKGSKLYVEGKLTTRSWEKDGKTNYMTEIKAESIQMLGSKQTKSNDLPY